MKRQFLPVLLIAAIFCSMNLMAQAPLDDVPPNPEPGKCYVKCVSPDVYETIEEKVMVKPSYKKLKVVPAEYKTIEDRVVVKEASKKLVYVPAKYKTIYEEVAVEEQYNKISIEPATFKDGYETIMIEPKTNRWEYQPYAGCESENPFDCRVLCWREYPEVYDTIETEELRQDVSISKTPMGGKTIKIKKEVVSEPAYMKEIEIPAQYKTVTRRVLVKDETTVEETVPAEYETVKVEKLVKRGGVSVWEEIDCELLDYSILPIFYELGSARLTEESKKIIDERLLTLMKDKRNVKVEISSHTDSRGSDASNLDLSERRAQSVVNYLISKGINPSRLVARGFGENRLKNRCANGVPCTEKEHQVNRRTEFRILNY